MDGIVESLTPPLENEAEITLLGGTDGYGECIIIHTGGGNWIVVDCCINPITKDCLPVQYLNDLHVDISKQVSLVVCTHWHDDHIKGLSKLIKECGKNTVLALSCAEDRQKFVYEFVQDYDYSGNSPVLKELIETINIANDKGLKLCRVVQDKNIYKKGIVSCHALSPSEYEVRKFEQEIAKVQARYQTLVKELLKQQNKNEVIQQAENLENEFFLTIDNLLYDKIELKDDIKTSIGDLTNFKDANKIEKNDRSVAMLISFGNHHVVLGADLEVNTIDSGWHSVLSSNCMDSIQVGLLKIPHHGSETGYLKDFMDRFVKDQATAKLTSWIKGSNVLPKSNMLKIYYSHTKKLFITTKKLLKFKNTESDSSIRKIMNEKTEQIFEIIPQIGIIRSRIDILSIEDNWETKVFGSALMLDEEQINNLV